jgi:outer membrane murein-binding lipoprotein Lpp
VGQPAAPVGINNNQIKGLEKRVASLESKVNTLKSSVDRLSKESSQTSPQKTASSVTSSNNTSATNYAAGSSGRVSVSAKVKVDNRYVSGTTYLPKVATGPEGVVVVNVTMGRIGTVGSVSINSASTINDEEILDLCKEAALKTNFAYNPDAPDKSKGTITYTFKKK